MVRGTPLINENEFRVRSQTQRIEYVYIEDTYQLLIKIRYEAYMVPLSGITYKLVCYKPLKDVLLLHGKPIDEMEIENNQDAYQYLIVGTEFTYEHDSYKINEVNIQDNNIKCTKFSDGTVHNFNNLNEINATIEHYFNN